MAKQRVVYRYTGLNTGLVLEEEKPGLLYVRVLDDQVFPDAEIPGLIAALQNYMSRRAKDIAKGRGK